MVPVYPADGAAQVELDPALSATIEGVEGAARIEGREYTEPGQPFSLVAIPDTQNYACGCNGGQTETFGLQTAWIAAFSAMTDLRFVTQLGDCVQNGDEIPEEWDLANAAMTVVENLGVPYGIVVGNHDQTPVGNPGGTALYNATFGISRFATFPWYVGHYGSDNDNHVETFEAGNVGWVVVHLEFDDNANPAVLAWLDDVLTAHADRRAIVATHNLVDTLGHYSAQGTAIYNVVRTHENVGLMLGGHVLGEGRREDSAGAHAVHSLLSDYQGRENGGDGWLRILNFTPATQEIEVLSYSPTRDEYERDSDSEFVLATDLSPATWPTLAGGSSVKWDGLAAETRYEWRVVVETEDGPHWGPTWTFTTGRDESPFDNGDSGADTAPTDSGGDSGSDSADLDGVTLTGGCGCQQGAAPGSVPAVLLGFAAMCRPRRPR